jgi:hypothetical protein
MQYSGKYEFVETVMYWGLTHEVMPKENALSCAQCHSTLTQAPYCGRCHQERAGVDFAALSRRGVDFSRMSRIGSDVQELAGKSNYIDFKGLGYRGDPVETGGRFGNLLFGKK